MSAEIEKKYLVNHNMIESLINNKNYTCKKEIKQGYILTQNNTVVRIRISDNTSFLTIKSENNGITRQEYEYEIPYEDGISMFNMLCENKLEKTRYVIDFKEKKWELDVFEGENFGLVVAEIELNSEEEPFEKPEWVSEEVSEFSKYYNVNLSKHPFSQWKKEENQEENDNSEKYEMLFNEISEEEKKFINDLLNKNIKGHNLIYQLSKKIEDFEEKFNYNWIYEELKKDFTGLELIDMCYQYGFAVYFNYTVEALLKQGYKGEQFIVKLRDYYGIFDGYFDDKEYVELILKISQKNDLKDFFINVNELISTYSEFQYNDNFIYEIFNHLSEIKKDFPAKQLSDLFNSYNTYFNQDSIIEGFCRFKYEKTKNIIPLKDIIVTLKEIEKKLQINSMSREEINKILSNKHSVFIDDLKEIVIGFSSKNSYVCDESFEEEELKLLEELKRIIEENMILNKK